MDKIQELMKSYRDVETEYLENMAAHIYSISAASTILELPDAVREMATIVNATREALSVADKRAEKLLASSLSNEGLNAYKRASVFYDATGTTQVSFRDNARVQRVLSAVSKSTSNTMLNISHTTATQLGYREAVDKAILRATVGVDDYMGAIRDILRVQASSGMSYVDYTSGHHRRMDSAVRMNVHDGMNRVNMQVARETGEEFGADGVEISAHSDPAPDHKHINGRRYTNAEYERVKRGLKRQVGEMNCGHFEFPIIMGVSSPTYTNAELDKIERDSERTINVDGVSKTKYQWSQEMRRIETRVRDLKNLRRMAMAGKDELLAQQSYGKYGELLSKYTKICNKTGLTYDTFNLS